MPRADAHIHLFETSYRESFTGLPGVEIDEILCYESLAKAHGIEASLIVCYQGSPWCTTNNQFVARIAAFHPWMRPLAYVDEPLTVQRLEDFKSQGFVGLSIYLKPSLTGSRQRVSSAPDDVWRWLVEHRWIVSVNARHPEWSVWPPILERHGDLRVVASHLGLPPKVAQPPDEAKAREGLGDVLKFAAYGQTRVKLSGFYAITDPGHEYPHESTWPYVQALLAEYGAERLLWASDYTPCLGWVSFPQATGIIGRMPFFSENDRQKIEGENLLTLLEQVR